MEYIYRGNDPFLPQLISMGYHEQRPGLPTHHPIFHIPRYTCSPFPPISAPEPFPNLVYPWRMMLKLQIVSVICVVCGSSSTKWVVTQALNNVDKDTAGRGTRLYWPTEPRIFLPKSWTLLLFLLSFASVNESFRVIVEVLPVVLVLTISVPPLEPLCLTRESSDKALPHGLERIVIAFSLRLWDRRRFAM